MNPRLLTRQFQAAHEDIGTVAADEENILVVAYAVLSWGGSVRELVHKFQGAAGAIVTRRKGRGRACVACRPAGCTAQDWGPACGLPAGTCAGGAVRLVDALLPKLTHGAAVIVLGRVWRTVISC